MSTGIFPDSSHGGVIYRDIDGEPTEPDDVGNAYAPEPEFISSGVLRALPDGCDAKFDQRQINALVSEMIALAEAMNPTGTWTLTSLRNLALNFEAWAEGTAAGTLGAIIDAYVDALGVVLETRTIATSGLAGGGGTLAANRTIDVPIASQVEAEAGALNTKAMTPLRVAQAIAAMAPGGGDLLSTNNLDDLDDVPTARTNLGLGTAALKNTGASGDAVPLLNQASVWSRQQSYAIVTLTDGATITWDVALGQKAKVTLAGNRTMAAVTNPVEGASYLLWVFQDGTGSRTITWTTTGAGSFDFGAEGAPTLTTTASKADCLVFEAVTIAGTLKLRYVGAARGFT